MKNGFRQEIIRYKKYSDEYIEFTFGGFEYRFISAHKPDSCVFPKPGFGTCVFECRIGNAKWEPIPEWHSSIDHIELLKGVDEYDKDR